MVQDTTQYFFVYGTIETAVVESCDQRQLKDGWKGTRRTDLGSIGGREAVK
jgi:hypothetical protein